MVCGVADRIHVVGRQVEVNGAVPAAFDWDDRLTALESKKLDDCNLHEPSRAGDILCLVFRFTDGLHVALIRHFVEIGIFAVGINPVEMSVAARPRAAIQTGISNP